MLTSHGYHASSQWLRLTVIGQLVNAEWVTFAERQQGTAATNGNLGGHIAKLVVAGI